MLRRNGRRRVQCQVWHTEQQRLLIPQARWCSRFLCKLRGYSGRRTVAQDEGLVLVETRDGRLNTAIHMLFVYCELGVIWLDAQGWIVDLARAQPWQLQLLPQKPARFVLECHPDHLARVAIGERLAFRNQDGVEYMP